MMLDGHCLCGAVGLTADAPEEVAACHCEMCRRWTGGPLFAVHLGGKPEVRGEENVTVYRSSDWAERAFCSRCGSGLWYRFVPKDEWIVSAGLFHDQTRFRLSVRIFTDEKAGWFELGPETPTMTGAEVAAKYMGGA